MFGKEFVLSGVMTNDTMAWTSDGGEGEEISNYFHFKLVENMTGDMLDEMSMNNIGGIIGYTNTDNEYLFF